MKGDAYRLEPLVVLSERRRRASLRRVAVASRRVALLRAEVLRAETRASAVTAAARSASLHGEVSAVAVRIAAVTRSEALLSVAETARTEAHVVRTSFDRASRTQRRRRDEVRIAERDAKCQHSARNSALEVIRLRARRRTERIESAMALEAWSAAHYGVDLENDDAC